MAVERCSVAICGAIGIQSALTRDSNADTTGNTAIVGKIISNCVGETVNTAVASAAGINASAGADNCSGVAVSGVGVSASNATNCHGPGSGRLVTMPPLQRDPRHKRRSPPRCQSGTSLLPQPARQRHRD